MYIAPLGNDNNPGTIEEPLATLQKAQELMNAGDTVLIRGGTYTITESNISKVENSLFACITYLDKSGTSGHLIHYMAYPGEQPVFDFNAVKPANQRVVGIYVKGEYIHIKGLEMTGIQVTITTHTESYCIYSKGSHNIFEQLSLHDNKGTGIRHYKGGYNLFLNCDAYRNHDDVSENQKGGNTDGFGCHPASGGINNVFRGCRSWFNSDDGYDCIRAQEPVIFENCWAFYNGYSPTFISLGDGNGFKAGGYASDAAVDLPDPIPSHTVYLCLAVRNKANGFYSNHHLTGNTWLSNSAYRNSVNFNMVNRESTTSTNLWVDGYDHVLKNNLGYQARSKETDYINAPLCTLENNYFNLAVMVSGDDFISLDENLLISPRNADGSLPDVDFMRLTASSDLIDKGIYTGIRYKGSAPDLGAFESDYPVKIKQVKSNVATLIISPNPVIDHIDINSTDYKEIEIMDLTGKVYHLYIQSGRIDVSWLHAGIYLIRLTMTNNIVLTGKFVKQ